MRKLILVALLIAAAIYYVTDRYAFQAGSDQAGKYRIVMVDKKTGDVTKLWGR